MTAVRRPGARGANRREQRVRADYAARPVQRRGGTRLAVALAAAAIACALALAMMRTDLIRVRYGLALALAEEGHLRQERRDLQVEVRRLRHPGRLAERARNLGFVRPERVIAWRRSEAAPPLQMASANRSDSHPSERR